MSTKILQLQLADENIEFRLMRTRRRSLAIYVSKDRGVEVRAPKRSTEREARAFLRAKWPQVKRKQEEFRRLGAKGPLQYKTGEKHYYLGQETTLLVIPDKTQRVEWSDNRLTVYSQTPDDAAKIEASLINWYRARAKILLDERLTDCVKRCAGLLDIEKPQLKIRRMRSRWGSCRQSGVITLNLNLIKFPVELIDYVIIHELCHLKEFNHSKGFYTLMSDILPDWQQLEEELESLAWRIAI